MPLFKRGGTEKPILTGRSLTTRSEDHMSTPLPTKNIGPELGEAEENGKKPFLSNNAVVGAAVVLAMGAVVTAIGVSPDAPVERGAFAPSSVSASYEPPSSNSFIFEEDDPEEEGSFDSESSSASEFSSSAAESSVLEEPAKNSLPEESSDSPVNSELSSSDFEASEPSSALEYVTPPEESSTKPEPPPADEPDPESSSQSYTSPPSNRGGGSGNADNFNTYDNEEQQKTNANYVLNTSTMKFHYPRCSSVAKIAPQNYEEFYGTKQEAISLGYDPCGRCKP